MPEASIVLVILAGGRSSRFGRNKALFPFEGKPLVNHVIEALNGLSNRIIVTVAPGRISEFSRVIDPSIEVIEDAEPFLGPLFGLRNAIESIEEDTVLLAPCDLPFINPNLYSLLLERLEDHDAAVPVLNGFLESTVAVYRTGPLKEAIRRESNAGRRKIIRILNHLDFVRVSEREWKDAGLDVRCFTNLNSPP